MSAHSPAAAVRACVSSWQFRSLRLQDSFALTQALTLLETHETSLYDYSPHASRLLAGLRTELASRTPTEPPAYCYRSRHTLPADAVPGLVRCLVCGKRVRFKTFKRLTAAA